MAAETSTTISLQARDWETIIGLAQTSGLELRRVVLALQTLYNVATPPQGTALVTITTKEKVLVSIATLLHFQYSYPVYLGTNNLTRIMTAIRALNTDGYITTNVDAIEAAAVSNRDLTQTTYRKTGRGILLVDVVDNN